MQIAAVGLVAHDLASAIAFYEALGFRFPPLAPGEDHVEAEGAVRLMIDTAELIEGLIGEPPRPANTAAFAVLTGSPREVDDVAGRASTAGGTVVLAPFDAPWGQRYATVADPDGYRVDLFCPLPGSGS